MVNVDSKLLQAIQQSSCFGIAHDPDVAECKQCDVSGQCRTKSITTHSGGSVSTPASTVITELNDKPKKEKATSGTKTKKKPEQKEVAKTPPKSKMETPKKSAPPKAINPNMPDFKQLSLDELKSLAKENSIDWKDYGNDNITRMRIIMSLKPLY